MPFGGRHAAMMHASKQQAVVCWTEIATNQPSSAHVARYGSLKLLLLCHSLPLTMRFRHGSLTVRPKLSSFTSFRNFAFCRGRQGLSSVDLLRAPSRSLWHLRHDLVQSPW